MAVIVAADEPALGLGDLEIAPFAATRRSVRSTSMKPPPIAKPLTAAMTGFSSAPVMNGSSIAGRAPPGAPRCQRFLHVLAGAEAAAGAGEDRDLEAVVMAESVQVSASAVRNRRSAR